VWILKELEGNISVGNKPRFSVRLGNSLQAIPVELRLKEGDDQKKKAARSLPLFKFHKATSSYYTRPAGLVMGNLVCLEGVRCGLKCMFEQTITQFYRIELQENSVTSREDIATLRL
jgi:hypothetical protein